VFWSRYKISFEHDHLKYQTEEKRKALAEAMRKQLEQLCVKLPQKDPVKKAICKLKELPRYSFLEHGGIVKRVNDSVGAWIERDQILYILDQLESDLLEMPK
jgi:hypothetical protein